MRCVLVGLLSYGQKEHGCKCARRAKTWVDHGGGIPLVSNNKMPMELDEVGCMAGRTKTLKAY